MESVLRFGITSWFGNLTVKSKAQITSLVRSVKALVIEECGPQDRATAPGACVSDDCGGPVFPENPARRIDRSGLRGQAVASPGEDLTISHSLLPGNVEERLESSLVEPLEPLDAAPKEGPTFGAIEKGQEDDRLIHHDLRVGGNGVIPEDPTTEASKGCVGCLDTVEGLCLFGVDGEAKGPVRCGEAVRDELEPPGGVGHRSIVISVLEFADGRDHGPPPAPQTAEVEERTFSLVA
ncbi:uncharacterized protein LOC127607729 [Hippocampus zosterae]|uniref:uncharacterized protein LOC127607729 n=1 Tax=Hippocampus zosterae TaxID=109293 RepID=UPI00223DA3F6|nr:uncharacterized protein LOC127607729 [Hippocampus zosterae]